MKEFFYGILALLVMIIISVVSVLLVIKGATFIFESWLVLLVIGVLGLFLTIDIVVFTLPLVLKVMPFALQVFTISSYVYGSILWLLSIYISHKVFGVFWLVFGLLFAGVGVLPIAIFGVILKQWWPILYLILFLLALTIITRFLPVLAIAIISVFEERSEINDYMENENNDLYLSDDSVYLESEKLSEAKAAELFVENVRKDVRDKWNFIYQELKTFGLGEEFLDNNSIRAEFILAVIALEIIPLTEVFPLSQATRIRKLVIDYSTPLIGGLETGAVIDEYRKEWNNSLNMQKDPLQATVSILIDEITMSGLCENEYQVMMNPLIKTGLGTLLVDLSNKRWETIVSRFELTE